ncbi:MAG: hypothetical protein U0802_01465 [Candidatus Binatia bacterium]
MLAVMVFALFLGVSLVMTRTEAARAFERALQGLGMTSPCTCSAW